MKDDWKINSKFKEEIYDNIDKKIKTLYLELEEYTNDKGLIAINEKELIKLLRDKITGRTD